MKQSTILLPWSCAGAPDRSIRACEPDSRTALAQGHAVDAEDTRLQFAIHSPLVIGAMPLVQGCGPAHVISIQPRLAAGDVEPAHDTRAAPAHETLVARPIAITPP